MCKKEREEEQRGGTVRVNERNLKATATCSSNRFKNTCGTKRDKGVFSIIIPENISYHSDAQEFNISVWGKDYVKMDDKIMAAYVRE